MEKHSVDPVPSLKKHLLLFEETHEVIQQENHGLLSGTLPSHELLSRKEHLLQRLTETVDRIRAMRQMNYLKSDALKKVRKQVQDRLLSILLLDRENEKLLLKLTGKSSQGGSAMRSRSTPMEVKRAYSQRLQGVSV